MSFRRGLLLVVINKSRRKYKQLLICSLGFLSLTAFSSFKSSNRIIFQKAFTPSDPKRRSRECFDLLCCCTTPIHLLFWKPQSCHAAYKIAVESSQNPSFSSTLFLVISLLRTMLHPYQLASGCWSHWASSLKNPVCEQQLH